MFVSRTTLVSALAGLCATALSICAQVIDDTPTRVQTTLNPDLPHVGTLVPKRISDLSTSHWSLCSGGLDRQLADYDCYKEYMPLLGIKLIRLQAGWARTEADPGQYDFAWLDHIINDAIARGHQIWLETSYGNPSYPGGGGRTLRADFPMSEEGLAAWDRWVKLTAERYKGKVRDWSMWNEPNINVKHTKEAIVEFNIRTAEIIKRVDPEARIGGLVVADHKGDVEIIEHFMKTLSERSKLGLFEWVVIHLYARNPDTSYEKVAQIREAVRRYSPTMKIWQGESGTQSEWGSSGALSRYPWTELSQAKWTLRRVLGDLGNDLVTNVFTVVDLHYRTTMRHNGLLRYGMIKTAGAAEGYKILKVKPGFYAVQNAVSVLNDDVRLVADLACEVRSPKPLAVYGFAIKATGQPIVTFWDKSGIPQDSNATIPVTLKLTDVVFQEPVWVDVITGNVYRIPVERVVREGNAVVFKDLPAYDSPVFITDANALTYVESEQLIFERTKTQ